MTDATPKGLTGSFPGTDTNSRDLMLRDEATTGAIFNGKLVILNASTISYAMDSLIAVPQQPAKTSTVWNTRLATGDWLGHTNPKITISGVIDASDDTPTTPANYTRLTLKIMLQFIKSGNILTLYDILNPSKSSATAQGYLRIHSLDSSDNPTQVKVQIQSFSFDSNRDDSKEEKYLKYKLELVEVKNE